MLFHKTAITLRDMAKAVVLLFLLETIPVLEVVSLKFSSTSNSVEGLFNDELPPQRYKPIRMSEETFETLDNLENILENSEEHSYEKVMEQSSITIDHTVAEKAVHHKISEKNLKSNGTFDKNNVTLPKSAPFLAAIFETVSSVTAQTCAGVLLSKDWVLTAASCVNVLRPFYSNSTSQTHNYYTIVIGASNPLIDGTVHNVSKVIVYPTSVMDVKSNETSFDPSKSVPNVTVAMLALMRIQPSLEGGELELMEETNWDGNATVYGWALMEGGPDMMLEAALPVQMLSSAHCRSSYGIIIERPSILCLSMNETTGNVTRMNSGGPVVVSQGGRVRLLAVSLTDSITPITAYRLTDSVDWLRKTIRSF